MRLRLVGLIIKITIIKNKHNQTDTMKTTYVKMDIDRFRNGIENYFNSLSYFSD